MESNSGASIFTNADGTHIANNRFECHVHPALPFCLASTRAVEIGPSATATTLVDNYYSGIGVVDASTARTTYRFDNGHAVEINPPTGTDALTVRGRVLFGSTGGVLSWLTVNAPAGEDPLRVRTAGTTRLMMLSNGNVGVGTSVPAAKLHVTGGDLYLGTTGNGVILRSPNGSCFRMTVSNAGAPGAVAVACP